MKKEHILDDRCLIFNRFGSQCGYCECLDRGNLTCPAFPDEIPDDLLKGKQRHEKILKGQIGNTLFSPEKGHENVPWDKLIP